MLLIYLNQLKEIFIKTLLWKRKKKTVSLPIPNNISIEEKLVEGISVSVKLYGKALGMEYNNNSSSDDYNIADDDIIHSDQFWLFFKKS